MKFIVTILSFCALCGVAVAQGMPGGAGDLSSTRSMSGQFIVVAQYVKGPSVVSLDLSADTNYLQLDPKLVAVSCERIRQAVWEQLDIKGGWQGKIQVALHAVFNRNEAITIVSERFKDGWSYRVEIPDIVERTAYVRAMVNVILLEIANRGAGDRSAEVPLWLSEGLTQQLLSTPNVELVPPPPRSAVNGLMMSLTTKDARMGDSLDAMRRTLQSSAPMTLQELSWPKDGQLDGESAALYKASAQLFTMELLKLKDGRASMNKMLADLAQYYNWQVAFLQDFRPEFGSLLDLEKWWSLQVVNFSGRNPGQFWSLEESWRKLDEIVRTRVEVRNLANEMPTESEVSLETIIRDWDFMKQNQVLNEKVRALELARSRIAQELAPMVDEYRKLLQSYLKTRQLGGWTVPMARTGNLQTRNAINDTLKQLQELEAKRIALREASTVSAPPARIN